jgi:hypothetical protein
MRAAAGTIWGVLLDLRLINSNLGPGTEAEKLAGKLDILSAELADAARMIRAAQQEPGGNTGTEGRDQQ